MQRNEFDEIVRKLDCLSMHEIIITEGDNYFQHSFSNESVVNVHSISKLVTAICVGIAIENGFIREGVFERVYPYIKNYPINNASNIDAFKEMKIYHLLTLTMGHQKRTLDAAQIKELGTSSLLEFVLNYPIIDIPGERFLYSSAPVYLMSVILSKATGMSLFSFASKYLFSKLCINDVAWDSSFEGYTLGCTGLRISADGLHKIGMLMINNGMYDGVQFVSPRWINAMKTEKIATMDYYDKTRALPKVGYGYNTWISNNGFYFCDGTDGQYVIMNDKRRLVIVTTACEKNMPLVTNALTNIL